MRLRAITEPDLPAISRPLPEDSIEFFAYTPANALHRRFAENGLITDDLGVLAIESDDGELAGTVSWYAVRHGPAATSRALNIGIRLFPEHRGRGLGTAAQQEFARYLFASTLVERLEAATDADNIPEQRSLEKAGFTREGVLRHAQFRAGAWRDTVLYSRLRGD